MNSGEKFGRYEIRKKIGSGGMGEVFLAHDTELERDIALKVLPAEFYDNEERMRRFKQEARAASALNHPNIITIYEVGEIDGRGFIATEYIDGETLRDKINRRELTMIDAVKIAEQIASALAVAHLAHIVHRDIKPENIMIRLDDYIKILDFGLAKPTAQETGTEDKTLQLVQTQAGMVMGSVRYMSPEQARGKNVDERTDIWSVGVILYEMITGKNPFDGETISDSLAALIHVEPVPVEDLNENVPEELVWIIRKTLKKKADERYQNIKDLALDLKELRYKLEHAIGETSGRHLLNNSTRNLKRYNSGENATLMIENVNSEEIQKSNQTVRIQPLQKSRRKNTNWVLPIIILGLAALIAGGAWLLHRNLPSPKFDSLEISKLSDAATMYAPTISADGKYIAYINSVAGKRSLAVRQVATGSIVPIADAPASGILQSPVFSPDANYIYYLVVDSGVGTLYQVPTLGGTAKKIVADVDSKVAISPDGKKIAYVRNNAETNVMSVLTADADGGNEETLTDSPSLQVRSVLELSWTPAGDKLLANCIDQAYSDELVKSKLLIFSVKDKSVNVFGNKDWYNANSLYWTKDKNNLLLVGKASEQEPAQIWEISYPDGEKSRRLTNDASGYTAISLAQDTGTIVGTKQDIISSLWVQNPATKESIQMVAENKNFIGSSGLLPLPDGNILVGKVDNNKLNFYTLNSEGRDEKTFTSDDAVNFQPSLSPDNQFIVFASSRNRISGIWRMDANGGNVVQLTKPDNAFDSKPLVLSDNKTIVFERRLSDMSKSTLMKMPLDGSHEPILLFGENSDEWGSFPKISPDGKHFAYTAIIFDRANNKFNRTVRVMAVGNGEIGKLEKQIDLNLGWNYRFTPDNKNLTYINAQGGQNIYNLPLDGSPQKPLTNYTSGIVMNFSWSPDGRKLYIVRGIINNELVLLKNSTQST